MQEEAINSVLSGNDTLVLLPTGGGKSLCYQVPAVTDEGVTLVISPLIALMRDQVRHLREQHIPAACIISGMGRQEIEMVLNNAIFGKIKLLYISPERLRSRTVIDHLRQMRLSMIAVDEAHCISQWGYDFRPPYLEIAKIRDFHPSAPVMALTATATPEVVHDIQQNLKFKHGKVFQSSFLRPNLSYSVRKEQDKMGTLLRIIRGVGGSGIIYVRNRRRTVEVAKLLNDNDIPAAAYHAGIELKERNLRQQQWIQSKRGVMVATNAFGMGIDKADVRFVIHMDIPESPEAYFQEAGRAGRDGKRAYAVLLYDDYDTSRLKESLEQDFPPINYIKNVYRGVCNYYQIPVGAGQDSQFDFKLEAICQSYGFEPYTFFTALKFLEREGLIALPEHNELQSKVHIPIDKETLYSFQVNNHKAGNMISSMLRLYGGMFTDFTPISESAIGKRCEMTELQVVNLLTELNRLQIVNYQKRTVNPQIVFTSPRIEISSVHINDRNYKELRQASEKRRNAMMSYVTDTSLCRSRQLLHYFGEESESDCGICDVCVSKRNATKPHDNAAQKADKGMLISRIRELLQEPMTIRQLALQMPDCDHQMLTDTSRELLDKGKIVTDQDFRMSWPNSK